MTHTYDWTKEAAFPATARKGTERDRLEKKAWTLDETKFFSMPAVRTLRAAARRARDRAIRRKRATPVRDAFLVELCLGTGLRVQETADLVCGDLRLESKPCAIQVRCGKGGKARLVWIGTETKRLCEEYLAWKRDTGEPAGGEDPLFRSSRGNGHLTSRALQKSFKRSLHRAGLPEDYGIHSLRHTFGTHLYVASRHNLRLVQKQLGHSSIRTTQIYVGVVEEDAERALEKLYAS